jgi:fructose-1,6-bisphosphatase/sedoheptulose 1,7-bisphosphatase-like protein
LGSIASAAVAYAAVTERVALKVAHLEGARYSGGGARTHTGVMSPERRVVRFMHTIHALEPEAGRRGFQL